MKSDLALQDFDSALQRIESFPEVAQRLRFRLKVVEAMLAKEQPGN